jgi:hypothetical protein
MSHYSKRRHTLCYRVNSTTTLKVTTDNTNMNAEEYEEFVADMLDYFTYDEANLISIKTHHKG